MAHFDNVLANLEQGSDFNIEQIVAQYFSPVKTTLEQGQVVDLYHTDGEKLIGFIEKLVPKHVMLEITRQVALTGHDGHMLVVEKNGGLELDIENIRNQLREIGNAGFSFLERSASTKGIYGNGHYWGHASTKHDVAADIVALHNCPEEYEQWVKFFETTGFAMQFNLRWRRLDNTFFTPDKAIISILEYAMTIMDAEKAIARNELDRKDIDAMLYSSNGQIVPNFAALVAEGLGLRKDCFNKDSRNGCASFVVEVPQFWQEATAIYPDGKFLCLSGDCFVSFTEETVIYPSAEAAQALKDKGYLIELTEDGRVLVRFTPTEKEGLSFFSAAVATLIMSAADLELITYAQASVEMKMPTVYALGAGLFYPADVPFEGAYTDPFTGRTVINNYNRFMPFSPKQSVGGTTKYALKMGKEVTLAMFEKIKQEYEEQGKDLEELLEGYWAGHQPNRTMLSILNGAFEKELGIRRDMIPFIGQELDEDGRVTRSFGTTCGNVSAPAVPLSWMELENNGYMAGFKTRKFFSLGYGNIGAIACFRQK